MKATKALEKTLKARVKILYKNAVLEIKKACKKGDYSCKITIINSLEDEKAHSINEKLFEKLQVKGYWFGSTENHTLRNTFWKDKELKQSDFISK
jgi:hypothetical protein